MNWFSPVTVVLVSVVDVAVSYLAARTMRDARVIVAHLLLLLGLACLLFATNWLPEAFHVVRAPAVVVAIGICGAGLCYSALTIPTNLKTALIGIVIGVLFLAGILVLLAAPAAQFTRMG